MIQPPELKSAILLGDFNVNLLSILHVPSSNPSYMPLQHLTSKFNFTQFVPEATRTVSCNSTITDHEYEANPSLVKSCHMSPSLGSFEHNCLTLSLVWTPLPITKFKRTTCLVLFKGQLWLIVRWDDCLRGPSQHQLSLESLEKQLSLCCEKARSSSPSYNSQSLPWITRELKTLFHKRNRQHGKAKSTGSTAAWTSYKRLLNKAVSAFRQAKILFSTAYLQK